MIINSKHDVVILAAVSMIALMALLIVLLIPFYPELAQSSSAGPLMDPHFRIPAMPLDAPYLPTATFIITWSMAIIGSVATLYALYDSVKKKTLVPVMLALSAIGLCIPEVFVDVVGAVFYPLSEETHAYTIWGRQMPWFIVAAWFGFAAPFLHYLYVKIKEGMSDRQIWFLFLFTGLISVPIEETFLHFGQYYYYGNQPLILIAKYPWWWLPCNSGGLLLAAALVYRFESYLQGWRSLAILLITPMSLSAFYAFIAMPCWIVVNANYGWLITQAAGITTILLGVAGIAIVIKLVIHGVESEAARSIDDISGDSLKNKEPGNLTAY